MSSSPESAVTQALDEVSEETRDILQRAHQRADEIAARSRANAGELIRQAERDARETREAANREAAKTPRDGEHDAQLMTIADVQNLRRNLAAGSRGTPAEDDA
ncbi:MAG: hypothetical protein JO153_00725 [Solirubrobacterales bacterium]|nr:hypothetical protein [Solirubrobacterales bacterium]